MRDENGLKNCFYSLLKDTRMRALQKVFLAMSTPPTFNLSIRAETPKTVAEGEPFKVTYHVRNIGTTVFPGGTIGVRVSWANLAPTNFVTHPININRPLPPNDSFTVSKTETPLAAGYTMFTIFFTKNTNSIQVSGGRIHIYLEDRRRIVQGMLFGAVRAKSHEEIYQREELQVASRSLRWAIYAFIATVVFGFVELMLRFFTTRGEILDFSLLEPSLLIVLAVLLAVFCCFVVVNLERRPVKP